MPRRQPPARSPLPTGAWLQAWARTLGAGPDERPLDRLEDRLRERYHADGALLTDSGTTALRLALEEVTPRDGVVAMPAFSCYDLATAAVGAGVRVTLYDLDPATLGPEPESLEAALADGADAAVVAPLFGIPVDWDRVASACRRHDVALIEDAAQGHGATWRGRPLGSLADLSVFSFGRGKGWTGSGGGALLWRGGRRAPDPVPGPPPTRSARAAAVGLAQAWLGRPSLYWIPASLPGLGLGETRYHPPGPARAMAPFQAALLLATEAAADREAERRRDAAVRLADRLDRAGVHRPKPPPGSDPGYLRLPVLVPSGLEGLRDPGHAIRLGVAASYPTPLDRLPVVMERRADHGARPGAERLARELVTLPTHGAVAPAERDRLPSVVVDEGP